MVSERGPLSETREEDFQHRGAWAKSRGEEKFCAKFEIFEFFRLLESVFIDYLIRAVGPSKLLDGLVGTPR